MTEGLRALREYAETKAAGFDPRGLVLTLHVSDPELCAELEAHAEGRPRHDFAVSALRIGTLALKHAQGRVDAERIREEGERILQSLANSLAEHQRGVVQQLTASLKEYFDPQSGRFNERIERLIKRDGELEHVLRGHVGVENSALAQTLSAHIGENSRLMRILDPQASDGLLSAVGAAVNATLNDQRERILHEFSLDNKAGALSRLVAELSDQHAQASGSLAERIQTVVAEFSLDREDSALSRLVRRVEQAQKQISSEFSLDADNSALARMRRELLTVIEKLQQANAQFQEQVLQKLTEATARKEESRRSTRHGHDFEQAVLAEIDSACRASGDIATHTGHTTGLIRNCKKGDIVVELGREHAAAGARIVIEAKEQASFTMKDALAEIEEARKNRDAGVGLFVLSARTAPRPFDPLVRHGNDVVVVWDADDPASDIVLAAALSVAKALCTRAKAQRDGEAANFEAIERAIRAIEKRLQDLDQIATWAGTIRTSGDNIIKKTETMRIDLSRQIGTLDEKLRDVKTLTASSM